MKVVYIAHPISGNIMQNIFAILAIVKELNLTNPDIVPFAPYITDCLAMDDTNLEQRARGIANDIALLKAGFIDEVWLYGPCISSGMSHEITLAESLGIPVFAKSPGTVDATKC